MSEKLVRDGKVAILYSPGFGAGWATWGEPWMATDRRLIEAYESGADVAALAEEIAKNDYEGVYIYTGGARDLTVAWLPVGTAYRIHEYDGYESVETASVLDQVA